MSEKYKVRNPKGLYHVTITTVGWVDIFIRPPYKDFIIDSLKFCQENKGLNIHAWVIMSSHMHMIVSTEKEELQNIIRDFKTYTSKGIIKLIQELPESRREWLLKKFSFEANRTLRGKNYKLWQDGFHPVELSNNKMLDQRLNYIHNNPIVAGIVNEPEHYVYSSARDYAGINGFLKLQLIV